MVFIARKLRHGQKHEIILTDIQLLFELTEVSVIGAKSAQVHAYTGNMNYAFRVHVLLGKYIVLPIDGYQHIC